MRWRPLGQPSAARSEVVTVATFLDLLANELLEAFRNRDVHPIPLPTRWHGQGPPLTRSQRASRA